MESMGKNLEILIPTFQRADCLKKNLEQLCKEIKAIDSSAISIIISDNCSQDETKLVVEHAQAEHPDITINYYRQDSNIGLEPNVVSLMSKATGQYVMWLGDDDYLAPDYLKFVFNKISKDTILGAIIPGLQNLYSDGSITKGRIESFETKECDCGYQTVYDISHLAHQMSGIVLRREGLLDSYLEKEGYRNPYLFIYWTSRALFDHGGIYAPMYKTSITTFNTKDWGYNKVGLLDEVFKSYYYFEDLVSEKELVELLLRFSVLHSYRYDMKKSKPFKLLSQYRYLRKETRRYRGVSNKLFIQLLKDYVLLFKN